MLLHWTWVRTFEVTLRADERFLTNVNSFMFFQITCSGAFVVTLGTAEWFIECVDSCMSLQISFDWALVVTLGTAEWFITCVGFFHGSSNDSAVCICNHTQCSGMVYHQCGFFMDLQVTQMFTSVITLSAAEWFITSVNSFMFLQINWYSWVGI